MKILYANVMLRYLILMEELFLVYEPSLSSLLSSDGWIKISFYVRIIISGALFSQCFRLIYLFYSMKIVAVMSTSESLLLALYDFMT